MSSKQERRNKEDLQQKNTALEMSTAKLFGAVFISAQFAPISKLKGNRINHSQTQEQVLQKLTHLSSLIIAHLGRVKRKCPFEHAQDLQNQVHPTHVQSLIRAFALH